MALQGSAMRTIWSITGVVVVATLAILGYREYQKKVQADARRTAWVDERDRLINQMFDRLRTDHQAWHEETQRAVESVAALAEDGTRQTKETYYALGLRLHGEGKMEASEAAYRKSIGLDPEWSWPWNGLGVVLFEMGREEEAREAFAKASALDPAWSRPHSDLSILLRLSGRLDEAEKEAARAIELAPDRLDAVTAYANVLQEQKRFDEAREYHERAIQADPLHPTPYYNIACLYSLQGDKEDALEYLRKAFDLSPSYARFARTDPDLAAVRKDPRFSRLVSEAGKKGK